MYYDKPLSNFAFGFNLRRYAKAQLEHQALRIQNLELAAKFSPNAWRAHNASLDAAILM